MSIMMDEDRLIVSEVEEVYTHVHTLHLALVESVNKQSQAKDSYTEGTESLGELELDELREWLSHLEELERDLDRKQKKARKVEEMFGSMHERRSTGDLVTSIAWTPIQSPTSLSPNQDWIQELLESVSKSKEVLDDIANILHSSKSFPAEHTDKRNLFWSAYDHLSKETDEEFIERYNGDLDVQLIFAGLFSAVCSTFIVDLKSDLEP
ncbi:hypothetical protein M422DRAFT_277093 [Sphaerobolus stellatus SS14]|uniref:DUF6535 domain-containing protein n=1 Tax=Sphaerobolus stellatus (strain SS14) TaxID=990650 RepID=A0A0C9UAE1_SPHS4|nr:hypothetical protein M422DRAFT_277093 [Sphaerobolus stellatus SS14]